MSDRSERRVARIAPGVDVPYPHPSDAAATAKGLSNRRRDTKPEVELRRALFARGMRFRVDYGIQASGLPRRVKPDIVFTRAKLCVFVDGCFWHCCPVHGTMPKSNRVYWVPKLRANVDRDRRVTRALEDAGWIVLRFWEHLDPEASAAKTEATYRRRLEQLRTV